MSSRVQKLTILFFLFILLAACAAPTGLPTEGADTARIAMAKSDLQRDPSPDVQQADLDTLVAGDTAFAFDLYQSLKGEPGNLFFSPYSLSTALGMTYAGARGETESQMAQTLHYTLPQAALHPAFNALDQELTANAGNEGAFQLSIINSLWGQQDFPFRSEFLDNLARNYGAGMRLVDYIDETHRKQARQAINTWVEEETQGKIKDLIAKEILTDMTRLVLANAIYFKGEWTEPFLNGTRDAPFSRLDGSQVEVPTMSRRAETSYAEVDSVQAIDLPYKGERISMLVLLPTEGQFEAFESRTDGEFLRSVLNALQKQDVKLYLPKFDFSAEFKLAPTLKAMGMPDAFDMTKADFSGMYDPSQVSGNNLYLSHVIHKAFVAVDEVGTEAAAASGVVAEAASMPIVLRVDRPFIFLIRDRQTGAILFIGRVVDPSG
jgi:serpin B